MSTNQNQIPSLYIPFVYTQTTDEKITAVIEDDYDLGQVKYIDRILKENYDGTSHYSVYVHFETFNFNERTERFLEHAKNTFDPPRLYYDCDNSWFWKVMVNNRVGKHVAPAIKVDYVAPPKIIAPPRLINWLFADNDDGVMPVIALDPMAALFMPIAPCLPTQTNAATVAPLMLPRALWKTPNASSIWKKPVAKIAKQVITKSSQFVFKYEHESVLLKDLKIKYASDLTVYAQKIAIYDDNEVEGSSIDASEGSSIDASEGSSNDAIDVVVVTTTNV